jgi:DNA-binding transcriptional ArsR family regulator
MRFVRALDQILGNASRVAVLRALVHLPRGYEATSREIARRAGVTHPLELRALGVLSEQGLVRRHRVGRADTYELNEAHVLTDLVRRAFTTEEGLQDDLVRFLREQVARHAAGAESGYLFGSATTTELRDRSDIDVALVWPGASAPEIESASNAISDSLRRRYGNDGQVIVRTSPVRKGNVPQIWTDILQKGIPLADERPRRRPKKVSRPG